MKTAKNNNFARNEASRIVYYRLSSLDGSKLWDNIWDNNIQDLDSFFSKYKRGYLGYGQLRRIFLKHLPREGKILEGGCGVGQYVAALRARGYDCIGVDFADKTVLKTKELLPDIPIELGDIRSLDLKDESIAAYISLGVLEHFYDGPQSSLREAFRVLKKGGLMLVSVPQTFRWRREHAHSENTPLPEDAHFYQFAFPPEKFRKYIEEAGFSIKEEYGYSLSYAFRLRFRSFGKLFARFPVLSRMDIILDRLQAGRDISRMRLFVAEKR